VYEAIAQLSSQPKYPLIVPPTINRTQGASPEDVGGVQVTDKAVAKHHFLSVLYGGSQR